MDTVPEQLSGGDMKKLLLGLMLCGTANATVTDLGVLDPAHVYVSSRNDLDGSFADTFTFSLAPGISALYFDWSDAYNFDFHVSSPFGGGNLPPGTLFDGSYRLELSPNVSPGPYQMTIYGHGGATFALGAQRSFVPGQYLFQVTAVPEASTWIMLLIGAAGIAWRMKLNAA